MSAAAPDLTLMLRIHARLAVAGLEPLQQRYLVAVRARCPVCRGREEGLGLPLEVGCYGSSSPRWACELRCDEQELDRLMLVIFEGSGRVE